jgi:hypothetical protein
LSLFVIENSSFHEVSSISWAYLSLKIPPPTRYLPSLELIYLWKFLLSQGIFRLFIFFASENSSSLWILSSLIPPSSSFLPLKIFALYDLTWLYIRKPHWPVLL